MQKELSSKYGHMFADKFLLYQHKSNTRKHLETLSTEVKAQRELVV